MKITIPGKMTKDEENRFEKWVYETRLRWAELAVGQSAEKIERLMNDYSRWEQAVRSNPVIHVREIKP